MFFLSRLVLLRGLRLALAPVVLASIYRDLGILTAVFISISSRLSGKTLLLAPEIVERLKIIEGLKLELN